MLPLPTKKIYLCHGIRELQQLEPYATDHGLILPVGVHHGHPRFSPTHDLVKQFEAREISHQDFSQEYRHFLATSFVEEPQAFISLLSQPGNLILYCTCFKKPNVCYGMTLGTTFQKIAQQLGFGCEFIYAINPCHHTITGI